LGLNTKSALAETLGEERADLNWTDENVVPMQEFIKRIVVGNTTAIRAVPGTLRSILANKLKNKEMIACSEFWGKPSDNWADHNQLEDSQTMASNLLNAIHCAGQGEELDIEINLFSQKDVDKFLNSIHQFEASTSKP
jgi:hypothetical protein